MTDYDPQDLTFVDEIIDKYQSDKTHLLAMLQEIQDRAAYLPRVALEHLSARLMVPLAYPYRLATFFASFFLTPRGKNICTVCTGTACHVRGAPQLMAQLEQDLGIIEGQTTADTEFSVETVNCVGACAMGPLVLINQTYHGRMTPKRLKRVIAKLQSEAGET